MQREEVLADLEAVDTPYWRLKTLMDAWCALWFWPVQERGPAGRDAMRRYAREAATCGCVAEVTARTTAC